MSDLKKLLTATVSSSRDAQPRRARAGRARRRREHTGEELDQIAQRHELGRGLQEEALTTARFPVRIARERPPHPAHRVVRVAARWLTFAPRHGVARSPKLISPKASRAPVAPAANPAVLAVLFAISFSHLLNDTIQSLIPAIYPLLKTSFHLSFVQVGLITLAFQMTASILQPFVGLYHRSAAASRSRSPAAWGSRSADSSCFRTPPTSAWSSAAAALVGMGSSIFHPESSRVAHLASGGRHGFAQSVFQVGGNAGSSLGPLLAALIVVPHGQGSVLWFALLALLGIAVLTWVGSWYRAHLVEAKTRAARDSASAPPAVHPPGLDCPRRPRRADLFEIFLPRQPNELLHFLSHPEVPLSRPGRAVSSVSFSLRRRPRHHHRRADRRSLRAQARHLDFHPRRRAVHHRPAPRQSALDRHPRRHHRAHSGLGLFRDPGLRAGTGPGKNRT